MGSQTGSLCAASMASLQELLLLVLLVGWTLLALLVAPGQAMCLHNGVGHVDGDTWSRSTCIQCVCKNNEAVCRVDAACAKVKSVCLSKGQAYDQGATWVEEKCAHCECMEGGNKHCTIDMECRQRDLKPLFCHDPIDVNGVRLCPRGENCRSEDGTVIRMGTPHHPREGVTCVCSKVKVNTVHCHEGSQHDQPPAGQHKHEGEQEGV